MVIIFGQRLCGRVDQVPGACYVATRFFHVYYIPLIPLSSWVIVEGSESDKGFRGQQIGLSGKSIVYGWLQAFLIIFGLVYSIYGAIQISELNKAGKSPFDGIIKVVIGGFSLIVWLMFMIRPFRAGPDRARQLLELLGVPLEQENEQQE